MGSKDAVNREAVAGCRERMVCYDPYDDTCHHTSKANFVGFPKDSFHGEILPGESSVNVHTEAANFTLVKSRESKHSSWLVSAKSLYSPF